MDEHLATDAPNLTENADGDDAHNATQSSISDEDDVPIKFEPPLYMQRYYKAMCILREAEVESLVEFGCAECKLVSRFKSLPSVKRAYGVDIDLDVLESNKFRLQPLLCDYIERRQHSLHVQLLHGSLVEYDPRLHAVEAVVMLEVIEHLVEDVLAALPAAIFGQIQPKLVYFTTPNSEFNELFPNFSGFRHPDHKFEWTRSEFQVWCNDVAHSYGYAVEFDGIGDPPPGKEHLGHCSQSALFRKIPEAEGEIPSETLPCEYALVAEIHFPADEISPDDRLKADIEYYLRMLAMDEKKAKENDDSCTEDVFVIEIPLERLMNFKCIETGCKSLPRLKEFIDLLGYLYTDDGTAVIYDFGDEEEEDSDDGTQDESDASVESAESGDSFPRSEENWDEPELIDPQFLDHDANEGAQMPSSTNCWAFPLKSLSPEALLNQFTPSMYTMTALSFADYPQRYRLLNARYVDEGQFDDCDIISQE
ncbi:hypothetical protein CAPTEDRAFT_182989 [Capitella teleta]|uniref:Small RNA 2'-O-methyltransferase n=1 Tax=Capitella teleta TaxID=283909 RepID=R7V2T8_CAPTE|nr:hypothetical protein CAPTEDRAFT_182989 [Capitella teleta]|eukprot:ELU10636.1 hypothetical protein CAPTEDRAFT_182989 [Capitella teleta]